MDYIKDTIQYPIIIILVFLFLHLMGRSSGGSSLGISFHPSAVHYFYPKRLWYILAFLNYGIAGLFFYIVYSLPNPDLGGILFVGGLGMIFAFLSTYGLWKLKNARVRIGQGELEFKYGRKVVHIELDKVRSAYIETGYILLDIGEKRKKRIPAIFNGNHQIVSLILSRYYRAENP